MGRSLFPEYHEKQRKQQELKESGGGAVTNKKGNDEANYHINGEQNTFQQMQEITIDYLKQMETNSILFASSTKEQERNTVGINSTGNYGLSNRFIPHFEPNEIQLGTMLGMGEFGVLLKVTAIHLISPQKQEQASSRKSLEDEVQGNSADTTNNRSTDESIDHPMRVHPIAASSDDLQTLIYEGIEQDTTKNDINLENDMMSRSITISKLDHATPLPIEQRAQISSDIMVRNDDPQHNHCQSMIMSQVTLDKETAQEKRMELAKQANHTSGSSDARNRSRIANDRTTTSSKVKLAIKQVRKDLYPKKKIEAAKDLAREAKFLARLDHPNIISLKGILARPGQLEFGMILDRLRITLTEEIMNWYKQQENIISTSRTVIIPPVIEMLTANLASIFQKDNDENDQVQHQISPTHSRSQSASIVPQQGSNHSKSSSNRQYTRDASWLLGERVLALWDIAQGMRYLHEYKILYRDLKTENVGSLMTTGPIETTSSLFQQYRMQIFDFGLAKECKTVDRLQATNTENDVNIHLTDGQKVPTICNESYFYSTYHMTGLTGTLRIMAPEVIQCMPYGLPADIYSFGICMWEVFSGRKSDSMSAAEICKGDRPPIPGIDRNSGVGMPESLQSLLRRCWSANPNHRPSFSEICHELAKHLLELQQQHTLLSSRNSSRNSSRSNSPSRRHHIRHASHDQHQSNHGVSAATATQAAFWSRLNTIHSSNVAEKMLHQDVEWQIW